MSQNMFGTLETTWDRSARRKWSTLASFVAQAAGLSAFVAVSLMWVEGPPLLRPVQITAPAELPETETTLPRGHHTAPASGEPQPDRIITPSTIPVIVSSNDADSIPTAPDLSAVTPGIGRGSGISTPGGLGDDFRVVIPPRPAIAKPLLVSHLDEANLLHRVQPTYPPIARLARVQGAVELRAIISKAGTVENLVVVSGHPMLAAAAIEAVRQWRYRPYLLNNQPIEVETEITVNFLLSGG
jgi:protein TonB